MGTRKKVLLVGNGINRLFGEDSWEDIIKAGNAIRAGKVEWGQLSGMPATMQIVSSGTVLIGTFLTASHR